MAVAAIAMAAGSVASSYMASKSADKAAQAQKKSSDAAIAEQRRQFDLMREDYAPYMDAGTRALSQIERLTGQGYGSGGWYNNPLAGTGGFKPANLGQSIKNWAGGFNRNNQGTGAGYQNYLLAPQAYSLAEFQASPDYQFRLNEGQKALDRSAAARGNLLSGAGVKAGMRYASDLASGEYGDWWDRRFSELSRQSSEYSNYYNRLAELAGLGQTSTSQAAGYGQSAASNIGNALIGKGNAIADAYTTKGRAQGDMFNSLASIYGGNAMGAFS